MIPDELKRLYQHGRVVPFVGAGVSMSVAWDNGGKPLRGPSWRELVNQAADEIGFKAPDLLRVRGTDLQILEYYRAKKADMGPLGHWLATKMQPPDDALLTSPIHRALAGLRRCSLFYTTNFDDLLERSLALNGRTPNVVAIEADNSKRSDGACEVIKFHGDLKHPTTMVLSEKDYQKRLSFSTPMDFRLLSDLLNRVMLFIGYSFNDPNVSYLFYRVNELLGKLPDSVGGHRAFILVADPSDFERVLFGLRNMSVIHTDGADRTGSVARAIEELGAA